MKIRSKPWWLGVRRGFQTLLMQEPLMMPGLIKRNNWFIALRWWVPVGILAGILIARILRIELAKAPFIVVSVFILVYNIYLYIWSRRLKADENNSAVRKFTYLQVSLDYAAMFFLIHCTGGVFSPLAFFLVFHIVFAAILLPPVSAYGFAVVAALGVGIVGILEYRGLLISHPFINQHEDAGGFRLIVAISVEWAFFTAAIFITAFSTVYIMKRLQKSVKELNKLSWQSARLNDRLNSLLSMIRVIHSFKNIDHVLDTATCELAGVMGANGISVKLLHKGGTCLRYAAIHGLPGELKGKEIEVTKSPLIKRVLEGEKFATGKLMMEDKPVLGEGVKAFETGSVLFVPLYVEMRIIGILGAYSSSPDGFTKNDIDFFGLAAGLVSIALDNAESYQTIEKLYKNKTWFMTRMAHNLRNPLSAIISMLDVIRDGYMGVVNPEQKEYLRRIHRRTSSMLVAIGELLAIAQSSESKNGLKAKQIDLENLKVRLQRTFKDEAEKKRTRMEFKVEPGLPSFFGDPDLLEQMMENLISNAIKYTRANGQVYICFKSECGDLLIKVEDNGIGIRGEDISQLFNEFFRAANARELEETGTGLGLTVVKEIVNLHGGRISVASQEGKNTVFTIVLPFDCSKKTT